MGGEWLTPRPDRFTPGKETRYLFYMRLGGPQGWSERVRNISSPPGFNRRTVQPVASRYTDWAIPAHREQTELPRNQNSVLYKVVQIWPGLIVCKQVTVCPGHIWTTLYIQKGRSSSPGIQSAFDASQTMDVGGKVEEA